jgi:hypothetical protein
MVGAPVNIKEGMRRLGIVLGLVGGAIGAMSVYGGALHLWNAHVFHRRFESLMSSDTLLKVAKDIKAFNTQAWKEGLNSGAVNSVEVNQDGIRDVTVDKTALISSIVLSSGESIPRVDAPTLSEVLAVLLYPIVGFLIPWGVVRVIVWLGAGFVSK